MIFQKILLLESDILHVKNILEKLLNVEFIEHESSFWGIYYMSKEIDGIEDIEIKNNYVDEEWQEDEFKDCPIIIYLNGVQSDVETLNFILKKLDKSVKAVFISDVQNEYCKKYSYLDGEKVLLHTRIKKI